MKQTINLFLDFEFTSLSPDAQPISLGIVSDERVFVKTKHQGKEESFYVKMDEVPLFADNGIVTNKSFYAEFMDFDINRCDDWVKENVACKLKYMITNYHDCGTKGCEIIESGSNISTCGDLKEIKEKLTNWLKQFSNYDIQFIVDCGTYDWYHLINLIGEWEEMPITGAFDVDNLPNGMTLAEFIAEWNASGLQILDRRAFMKKFSIQTIGMAKAGLPKLPSNISPVPFDLNDLIAIKKGITPKEAFNLDREFLDPEWFQNYQKRQLDNLRVEMLRANGIPEKEVNNKHNSLYDAKVIKAIYNKLI